MPGLITHYICGEAVLNKLEGEIGDIIRKYRQLYNVGTQGPDIFFYYLPGLIRKNMNDLGSKMHKGNFRLFIKGLAEAISKIDGEQKKAAASYVCGYLTHYALDYSTHPYIYCKTGSGNGNGKLKNLKYSVYHRNFETSIDVLMLKMVSGEKPAEKKLWEMINVSRKEALDIAGLISSSIADAYDVAVTAKQVYKSFKYMIRITRLLQSKNGRRKQLMEFAEGMTIGEKICSSLIHIQEITDGIDYLNIAKKPWSIPWDGKKKSDSSFTEMFNESVDIGKRMIDGFYNYIYGGISIDELLEMTGNFSFATGLEYDVIVEFQFYDTVYE